MSKLKLSSVLSLVGLIVGCGSGGNTPPQPSPPQSTFSISPPSANVAAGGSQQFAPAMAGNANPAVIWAVNGIAGGTAATGTISPTGLYTAPNGAASVVVSAVLQSNQTDTARASVSVLAPHRIGVRTPSTLAEFYDRASGSLFRAATIIFGWPVRPFLTEAPLSTIRLLTLAYTARTELRQL